MDVIDLKGTLAVSDGFSPAGATLQVSVGGVVKSFTLDAEGKAKIGTDQTQVNATLTNAAVTIPPTRKSYSVMTSVEATRNTLT